MHQIRDLDNRVFVEHQRTEDRHFGFDILRGYSCLAQIEFCGVFLGWHCWDIIAEKLILRHLTKIPLSFRIKGLNNRISTRQGGKRQMPHLQIAIIVAFLVCVVVGMINFFRCRFLLKKPLVFCNVVIAGFGLLIFVLGLCGITVSPEEAKAITKETAGTYCLQAVGGALLVLYGGGAVGRMIIDNS